MFFGRQAPLIHNAKMQLQRISKIREFGGGVKLDNVFIIYGFKVIKSLINSELCKYYAQS